MSAVATDYGALLAEAKPEVVHKDELNRAYLQRLESFLGRNDLTAAEEKLFELLTLLISKYETERYKIDAAPPIEVIRHLIEHHGLKQKDLVPGVFESESVASATLNGDRDLTIKHINRLADKFNLSREVFIDPTKR